MAALNPMQLLAMLKQGNPQYVAEQIIRNNFPNDPTMQNLLAMGQRGDVQGLQQYAQQLLGSQGRNFDIEMQNLLNMIKGL
jgi:hypothetical protein